ncbi:MAG TPA: methyltransferase domain-containing protein [Firmicutes bacterium]|nr:methyltransferase domain-containing protein [Bacillota bacterium]
MSGFCCPACGQPLAMTDRTYACPRGHSFDRGKSGYVNLLLPGAKHSKAPGDNPLMVMARRDFLERGHYRPLCEAVCGLLSAHLPEGTGELTVLDAGCGEGYYTEQLRVPLGRCGRPFLLLGADISKTAADKAARRARQAGVPLDSIRYAAASVFHLPLPDKSCDVLLNLFAPYCGQETRRVLRPGGLLLLAVPGERHLLELKEAAYDHPYRNEVRDPALEGFTLLEQRRLEYPMTLKNTAESREIDNLFRMTPYYYKTGRKEQARVEALETLRVTAAFVCLAYRRC